MIFNFMRDMFYLMMGVVCFFISAATIYVIVEIIITRIKSGK